MAALNDLLIGLYRISQENAEGYIDMKEGVPLQYKEGDFDVDSYAEFLVKFRLSPVQQCQHVWRGNRPTARMDQSR